MKERRHRVSLLALAYGYAAGRTVELKPREAFTPVIVGEGPGQSSPEMSVPR